MGTITLKKQSAASVSDPSTDQLRLFVDSSDGILKTKDSFGFVSPSGVGTANELATTGAPVDVSVANPPSIGRALTATSPTTADWLPPFRVTSIKAGPTTYSAVVQDLVRVNLISGSVTVNLPSSHLAGDQIMVKLVSNAPNNCVIDASGSQTIDGALTLVLSTAFEWAILCSDGINWMQVG